jgi:hypothetical protein
MVQLRRVWFAFLAFLNLAEFRRDCPLCKKVETKGSPLVVGEIVLNATIIDEADGNRPIRGQTRPRLCSMCNLHVIQLHKKGESSRIRVVQHQKGKRSDGSARITKYEMIEDPPESIDPQVSISS